MEFKEVLKVRRSVRSYKPDPVPESAVKAIMDAALAAPTACNLQAFKVLFVRSPKIKEAVCDAYSRDWLKAAPAIVAVLGDARTAWKRVEGDSIADVDAAIVMEHMALAAADEGLGSCWICAFDRRRMDMALEVEAPWRTFAISPIGFAAESPSMPKRKSIDQLFEVID